MTSSPLGGVNVASGSHCWMTFIASNHKLCGVVALIAAAPYWLYQIWAFVLPGLHEKEKRYSRMFAAVAGPLFLGGVALGYYVLPKGLTVLGRSEEHV